MLVGFFKSNHKIISVLIVFLTLILWIPSFWNEAVIIVSENSVLADLKKVGEIKWLNFLVASFYLGIQAIYLNYIVNRYKLIKTSSYIVALLFVLLNSASTIFLVFNPIFIVNTFLLVVLHQLFDAYNKEKVFSLSFNTGFLIAIATLIYYPVIVVFPLIWFALIYLKTPVWREFVISLFGFTLPILFYASYCFFNNELQNAFSDVLSIHKLFSNRISSSSSHGKMAYFIALIFVGLLAGVNLLGYLNRSVVKIKKLIIVVLVMTLLLILSLLINEYDYMVVYLMMTIPLAIIIANYFTEIKKQWLAELLFLSLLMAIVWGHFS
ncbi:MAG: hypothetical protein J5I47_12525 [Vicingus serpentipes]|nr:hypothetical protein [Vicingus serpentipes]